MTSDAKIGLLLGFVFILVIVSLVNGLPGIIGKDSADNGIKTTVPTLKTEYGFTDNPGRVVDIIDDINWDRFKERPSGAHDDPRFTEGHGGSSNPNGRSSDKNPPAGNKKYYVVKEGDNLARIARKIYGKEIGNKQATIDMLYKANSNILDSPDDIDVGQKLIIPPLNGEPEKAVVNSNKNEVKKNKSKGFVGTVIDAGKNLLGRNTKPSTLYAVYVVKDEDNLWKIASRQLGSGARSDEIKKLNNGILKGSTKLLPGMKIKIPKK